MDLNLSKSGVLKSESFFESNGMNQQWRSRLGDEYTKSYSYTPTTADNSCIEGYVVWTESLKVSDQFTISIDVSWSGFDSSNTSGTFDMWFQGSQRKDTTWGWTTGNPFADALNVTQDLGVLMLSATSGRKTITANATISTTYVKQYNAFRLGIRSDYSNGSGTVTISNLKIIPHKYDTTNDIKIRSGVPQVKDMELRYHPDGSIWARLLHQYCNSGANLFTTSNVENIQTTNLYSRMYMIENFRQQDGSFEFMVIQPSHSPTTYYRWKQTNNPIFDNAISGYVNIENSSNGICKGYASAALCARTNSGGDWWCAVGAMSTHNSGIPGFGQNVVQTLDFYARVDTLNPRVQETLFNNYIATTQLYEI